MSTILIFVQPVSNLPVSIVCFRVAGHPLAQNERCLHMFLQDESVDKSYTPSKIRQAWMKWLSLAWSSPVWLGLAQPSLARQSKALFNAPGFSQTKKTFHWQPPTLLPPNNIVHCPSFSLIIFCLHLLIRVKNVCNITVVASNLITLYVWKCHLHGYIMYLSLAMSSI